VAADFDPRRLCIELTESLFVHRTDKAQAPLDELRALGMKIGIDDFGTGYSSLSYLHRLPLDVLKIPREFVERLGGAEGDSILAQSIVALAAAMNLRTIGEGIETAEQLRALRELGCELGQGYLLARPGPIERVIDTAAEVRVAFDGALVMG
jgi:EAL domain-containing protein (putative c-di-GMP-specific phosphodiesterase class I)